MGFQIDFSRFLDALRYSVIGMLGILIVTGIIIAIMTILVDVTAKDSKIRKTVKNLFGKRN